MWLVPGKDIAVQLIELRKTLFAAAFGVMGSQMYPAARIAGLRQILTRQTVGNKVFGTLHRELQCVGSDSGGPFLCRYSHALTSRIKGGVLKFPRAMCTIIRI